MTEPRRIRLRTRWQIGIRYSGFKPTVRAIAWALSTWMAPDGDKCRPSVPELASAVGVERDTVFRALRVLEKRGWVKRHSGGGRGRATVYEPLIPVEMEAWIEAVLEGRNRRTDATVSGAKPSHRITRTVAPDAANGRTGETPAFEPPIAGDGAAMPPPPWAVAGLSWDAWIKTPAGLEYLAASELAEQEAAG